MKKEIKTLIFNKLFLYKVFMRYKNINALFYRKKNTYEIKDIIVCGVQRSGSTLLFNIINEVLNEQKNSVDSFFEEELKYKKILANELSTLVKKNHTYLPMVARRVRSGKSIGFFTHRDIRDVIVSSIQKGWLSDINEWVTNLRIRYMINNSILYATTPNMHIFSYDKLMNYRTEVISEIADVLNIPLSEEAIQRISAKTSIDVTRNKLKEIPSDVKLEYSDQLHKNHIADGVIGKWRNFLSEEEINFLTVYCQDYLSFFRYKS
ncbi:MAG: sulfotransferase domain-containing protein [Cyclobacteriaceae bacterium]